MSGIECSVVVPVYNSRDCLEELCDRLHAVFGEMGIGYEIILVDDGSTDDSWAVIRAMARVNSHLVGLHLRRNFGQDNALMAGLRKSRGNHVVIMDDDLQHDPVYIKELYAEAIKGFDVVYANYMHDKRQRLWKNCGSWINDTVAGIVLRKPKNMYLSPYKIIARPLVAEICRYEGPYPYVDGLLFRTTSSFSQILIQHRPRFSGVGNYTALRSILVWSNLTTNFSVFPLRIATVMGLLTAGLGLVNAATFFVNRFVDPNLPIGWTSVFVSIQILGGVQLFAIGIVGEYIGKAYLNINRHPQYSIGECVESPPSGHASDSLLS